MSVLPTIELQHGEPVAAVRSAVRRVSGEDATAAVLGLVPVVALGLADGGFSPRPWGWATLGLAAVAAGGFALRHRVVLSRRPALLLAMLAALGLWIAASLFWSQSPALGVLELQRLLVYLAGVAAAALFVVHVRSARALVVGVYAATCAVTTGGLVSYLLTRERAPDVFQGAYLHRPLGYANAMAITSVIAILLALGLWSEASSRRVRIVTAATLVPLASALMLTGSRAAMGALVAGLAFTVVLAPNRAVLVATWRWLAVAPLTAAVAISWLEPTRTAIVGDAADALGERLLVLVAALTALAIPGAAIATRLVDPRGGRRSRWWSAAGAAVVVATVALGVGGFPDVTGDRPMFWRVAASEAIASPILGSGAGTYRQMWLERRPVDVSVRDAHSIVVETLAELGPLGVALVVCLLVLPLLWASQARTQPLVPAVGGAFAAYALHASVDWDWELPAITLAALYCAVALGVTADGERRALRLPLRARGAAVALAACAAIVASVGLVAASALEDASRALAAGDALAADRAAARASHWQPWSAEPLLLRGQARASLGDDVGARRMFARAAARDPNDFRAWLGLAAVSRGDAARAAVLRARALNPRGVRVLPGGEGSPIDPTTPRQGEEDAA